MRRRSFILLLVALAAAAPGALRAEDATEGLSPAQLLAQARAMFPRERIEVTGALVTAKARGLTETERPYALTLDWAGGEPKASCALFRAEGDAEPLLRAELTRAAGAPRLTLIEADGTRTEGVRLNSPVGESDLTWMDLAFDYLWWTDVRRLDEAELEAKGIPTRQNSRACVVLEAKPPTPVQGLAAVRLWVDKGSGNLLQTEQLDAQGRTTRQMYVQRLGREEGRWVPREFRVRRLGTERVTKLTVRSIRSASFSTGEGADA